MTPPRSLVSILTWRLIWVALGVVLVETILVIHEYGVSLDPHNWHELGSEFVEHVLVGALPLFAVTAIASIMAVRSGLRGLRRAASEVAALNLDRPGSRIATEGLPAEAATLVNAINGALDRVEWAFADQRAFTGEVAHDLRTPMAVLRLAIDDLPAHLQPRFSQQVDAMARRVGQLVTLAQIEARPGSVGEAVDLAALAADLTARMAPLALDRGLNIAFDRQDEPVVWVQRDAIDSALQNLVENAIKHAPEGSEVTVRVGPDAVVVVDDQGPGIPSALRQRLFGRFERGQAQADGGVGLGLAIARRALEASGGHVEITDAPGGGARVILRFPKHIPVTP